MKRIIIVTIVTVIGIVTSCFAHKNYISDNTNDALVLNTLENESEVENIVNEQEEIVLDISEQENVENQEIEISEKENIDIKESVETIEKEQKNNFNTQKIVTKNDTENVIVKQESEKQSNVNNVSTQEKKEESKEEQPVTQRVETKKELTENDFGYWCVDGGSHHVAGDGANEHGYYNSWNEAYVAFENYTQSWNSVQFKVSECLCGKFYFWAIQ